MRKKRRDYEKRPRLSGRVEQFIQPRCVAVVHLRDAERAFNVARGIALGENENGGLFGIDEKSINARPDRRVCGNSYRSTFKNGVCLAYNSLDAGKRGLPAVNRCSAGSHGALVEKTRPRAEVFECLVDSAKSAVHVRVPVLVAPCGHCQMQKICECECHECMPPFVFLSWFVRTRIRRGSEPRRPSARSRPRPFRRRIHLRWNPRNRVPKGQVPIRCRPLLSPPMFVGK